jgi:hypothetical protein
MTETLMPYWLICEGACNPNLAEIDRQVQWYPVSDRCPRGEDVLWVRQRALRYQPHAVSGHIATCDVCGMKRRYGGKRF